MKTTLRAVVAEDGKFVWADKLAVIAAVGRFKGKEVDVDIEERSELRSYLQNRYWWGVVIPMVRIGYKDTGVTLSAEDAHEVLLEAFLREAIIDKDTGEIVGHKTGRTSALSKKKMIELIEEVQHFAAEKLHIVIPDPDPNWRSKKK